MAFNSKKYARDFLAAMLAYAIVLIATRYGASHFGVEGPPLVVLAGLPIIPAVAATIVFLRHYATMDELHKRIHIEAFAAGALFVGFATFSLGFLEDVAAPRLSMIWVLPAMLASWGIAAGVLRRRYLR